MTTLELFPSALEHHQAGRLSQAEALYRQILQSEPNHADALHLLGVLAHQVGNHAAAIPLISRSIELEPDSANVHNNLGGAYRALQKHAEAMACFQRAVELRPEYCEALLNLGHVLMDQQRFDQAISHYRRASELKPDLPQIHATLGNALMSTGQWDEAIGCFQTSLAQQPANPETTISLGNALKQRGRLLDALDCYQQVVQLRPDLTIGYLNSGATYRELGKAAEAVRCFQRALELNPHFAEAHNNLGIALNDLGQPEQASSSFRRALELKPDYADALNNLGNSLSTRGALDEAETCYRSALALRPEFAQGHNNLGVILQNRGKLNDAVQCFERALELDPHSVEVLVNLSATQKHLGQFDDALATGRRAHARQPTTDTCNQLGNILKDQGRLDQALDWYRQALKLDPNNVDAHSNLIYTQLFTPDYDAAQQRQEHRRWDTCHAKPFANQIRPYLNDRNPDRRLRIGYVSPDFRNHVVGRNLIPLFREHDHQQFEIYCYSNVPNQDQVTRRFESDADVFRNIAGLSDDRAADMVREDQIDILVDLTLHMALNRLRVFARKPSPLQLTFAGYPGTTGLGVMDYRLTDPHLDPPQLLDAYYAEESVRLPHSFWCYDPLDANLPVTELPFRQNGYTTFGCLNNFCKVNEITIARWSRILRASEGSRMTLLAGEGSHRTDVLRHFADAGISADRVTFVRFQPRHVYLQTYSQIDVGLDTLPYNGHSTSLDALWMGVPVVTQVGETVVGRAGLSQLKNLGLPELAAHTPEKFVEIAIELSRDTDRLNKMRKGLRPRMQASPLMDAKGFARNIEAVYREVWKRWCHDGP